ncbi:MAG: EscU/YscU/HrcU family type III secretion system export apparatus switch protein [Nocardioidaceae bacterium]
MSGGSEEKTEKPTPKKVKENRKEGRVPRTPEFGAWAAMLAVAYLFKWLVGRAAESIRTLMARAVGSSGETTVDQALALLRDGAMTVLWLSVGLGLGILVIGVLAGAAQGGVHIATKSLKPKWSRLNPLEGAKRLFGPNALWEGGKVLLKSSVVAFFVWQAVQHLMPIVGGLVPVSAAIELVADEATMLIRNVAIAGLIAAAVDYLVQRKRLGKQTRMTKKEVRDENKQSEGDPLIRHAMRSRQMAAARNRMMVDVPTADVVLVNPTHVAVALRYEADKSAPRVVAKGAGAIAARIRERAEESRVPLVEDVPLARALHASCEIGQEVPAELYQAVAQVLAYIFSRRDQGVVAGRHRSPRDERDVPEVSRGRRRRPVVNAGADASGLATAGR